MDSESSHKFARVLIVEDEVLVSILIEDALADLGRHILQYTFTPFGGSPSAKIGAEVIAYNNSGVLLEQITGYVLGQTSITLNPNYFIVLSLTDLSTAEAGYAGPPASQLAFGQVGGSSLLPEPSSIALFSVMALGIVASRLPFVRQFISAFR